MGSIETILSSCVDDLDTVIIESWEDIKEKYSQPLKDALLELITFFQNHCEGGEVKIDPNHVEIFKGLMDCFQAEFSSEKAQEDIHQGRQLLGLEGGVRTTRSGGKAEGMQVYTGQFFENVGMPGVLFTPGKGKGKGRGRLLAAPEDVERLPESEQQENGRQNIAKYNIFIIILFIFAIFIGGTCYKQYMEEPQEVIEPKEQKPVQPPISESIVNTTMPVGWSDDVFRQICAHPKFKLWDNMHNLMKDNLNIIKLGSTTTIEEKSKSFFGCMQQKAKLACELPQSNVTEISDEEESRALVVIPKELKMCMGTEDLVQTYYTLNTYIYISLTLALFAILWKSVNRNLVIDIIMTHFKAIQLERRIDGFLHPEKMLREIKIRESRLQETQSRLANAENRFEQAQERLEQTQEGLANIRAAYGHLFEEHQRNIDNPTPYIEKQRRILAQQIEQLNRDRQRLNRQVERRTGRLQEKEIQYQSDINRLQGQKDQALNELQNMEDRFVLANRENQALQDLVTSLRERINDVTSRLEEQLKNANTQNVELRRTNTDLIGQLEERRVQLEDAVRGLEEQGNNQELRNRLRETQEILDQTTELLGGAVQENEHFRDVLAQIKDVMDMTEEEDNYRVAEAILEIVNRNRDMLNRDAIPPIYATDILYLVNFAVVDVTQRLEEGNATQAEFNEIERIRTNLIDHLAEALRHLNQ